MYRYICWAGYIAVELAGCASYTGYNLLPSLYAVRHVLCSVRLSVWLTSGFQKPCDACMFPGQFTAFSVCVSVCLCGVTVIVQGLVAGKFDVTERVQAAYCCVSTGLVHGAQDSNSACFGQLQNEHALCC